MGLSFKHVLMLGFILWMAACAGGSSGQGDAVPSLGLVSLRVGMESVDDTYVEQGRVHISFPTAVGDKPSIKRVVVDGSIADGLAVLPDEHANIRSDGVVVYMPFSGIYTVTITIGDIGDDPIDRVLSLDVPLGQSFSLSGNVEDGEIASETGVATPVYLYWRPAVAPSVKVATVISDSADNGRFAFNNLLGDANAFDLLIAGSEL